MANSYFQFKRFTINQDKCAMKVCTDACLFGAIAANIQNAVYYLDIGTGTGLLPLMLAQKNPHSLIDAVEIDTAAYQQATENIEATAWADRIKVFNTDILTFDPGKQYDFIISNPPFFTDHLKSPDAKKNNAKHNTTLELTALLKIADSHLTADGIFAVLLPYKGAENFIEEAIRLNLHLTRQILVKQTLKHKFFRSILFFKRKESLPDLSEIIIKDGEGNYTNEFSAFLKDYYMFL
jgi:tRNA1Val (adenine37-N6)-methyltransferase